MKELVLGPYQGPLACLRIAYGRGVCGTAWKEGRTIIVPDVEEFPGHIACSSESRSKIVISLRHEGEIKKRALAKSSDGISGWRDLVFEEKLTDPVCMGSMTHRDGLIYHSNCDSATDRINLTVKISRDCFESCESIVVSDGGGYSDIALLEDKLFVIYEKAARNGPFELFFDVINI